MKLVWHFFNVAAWVSLLSLPAIAGETPGKGAQKELLIVGTEWPPFEFTDGDEFVGTDVDIIKAIFSRLEMPVRIESLPWVRAIAMIENKTADIIFTLRKSEERKKFMIFPDEPINVSRNVLFHRKDKSFKYRSMKDLDDLLVGSVRGYAYGDWFSSATNFRHEHLNEDRYGFLMLQRERIDLFVCDLAVGNYYINKLGLNDLITSDDKVLSEFEMFAAFAKTSRHKKLAEKFSKTLREIKKDGTYDEIIQRYQNAGISTSLPSPAQDETP